MTEKFNEVDAHFGLCPKCHCTDGHLNVQHVHFYVCHSCKTAWLVGANLFGDWRYEDLSVWAENDKLLQTYEQVEPYTRLQRGR